MLVSLIVSTSSNKHHLQVHTLVQEKLPERCKEFDISQPVDTQIDEVNYFLSYIGALKIYDLSFQLLPF